MCDWSCWRWDLYVLIGLWVLLVCCWFLWGLRYGWVLCYFEVVIFWLYGVGSVWWFEDNLWWLGVVIDLWGIWMVFWMGWLKGFCCVVCLWWWFWKSVCWIERECRFFVGLLVLWFGCNYGVGWIFWILLGIVCFVCCWWYWLMILLRYCWLFRRDVGVGFWSVVGRVCWFFER